MVSLFGRKKNNNKGFTLIELMAAMIIVGIISVVAIKAVSGSIESSKKQKIEQSKKNVEMAAQMYAEANKDLLPREIGDERKIYFKLLRNANYLKDVVVDEDGNDCMEDSYVRVYKKSLEEYEYTAVLICDGAKGSDSTTATNSNPTINAEFTNKTSKTEKIDNRDYEIIQNVSKVKFKFNIKDEDGIEGYTYTFYTGESPDHKCDNFKDFKEAYSSGTVKGNKKKSIDFPEVLLSKYIDITNNSCVKLEITAIDVNGNKGVKELSLGSSLSDDDKPDCVKEANGLYDGEKASDDDWISKKDVNSEIYPEQVSVKCNDKDGSGCKRDYFSRSWPSKSKNEIGKLSYEDGARWAYVVIEDNAVNTTKSDCNSSSNSPSYESCSGGNKRVCYVRVNVDTFSPEVSLKVTNPKTKAVVKELTVKDKTEVNNENPSGKINPEDYKGADGVDKKEWLNLTNFPDGIELSFDAKDKVYLYRWTWETNDAYLPYDADDTDVTKVSTANSLKDGTVKTEGYFDDEYKKNNKWKADSERVENNEELKYNETGPLTGSVSGLKLKLEGKRYGKLTVYDRAGNSTTIHVYANIDRTPPEIPDMTHKKTGATTKETVYGDNGRTSTKELVYKASGEIYENADKSNYTDNYHWSKETLQTYITGQREDKKATASKRYDTTIKNNGELSGWWKFVYTYELQNPSARRYTWKSAVTVDSSTKNVDTIDFKDEGTHKVRVLSCDKAKNCSDNSADDYLKIDYTLPTCGIVEKFTGVSGCTENISTFSSSGITLTSSKSCYNKNGWLKKNESVELSHKCDETNTYISSNCNADSSYNKQKFNYNFDIETGKAGANGYESSITGTTGSKINSETSYAFRNELSSVTKDVAGGHVIDYAGNVQQCPVKTVKIDYILPTCTTKIEYGIEGSINSSVHTKRPDNQESGWLSLYNGGINGETRRETATVSHVCVDNKSTSSYYMSGVESKCDTATLKSTVYNWELRTTVAGALGVGQGGEIADLAGNIQQCPADRQINIDYTKPKCTTIIEYPQGGPINQTSSDVESGWLGNVDNRDCNRTPFSSTSATSGSNVTNGTLGNSSVASNIKGVGNAQTVSHNAYLSSSANPTATLTRAEFAKILCNALGVSPVASSSYIGIYTDVTQSTSNWNYIEAASQNGFFIGTGDHKFSPSATLTRAQLATAIARAAASRGVTSSKSCSINYTDNISEWASDDISSLSNSCFMIGVGDGTFSSDSNATIAQVATVIYRVFRETDENTCKDSSNATFDASSSGSLWYSAAMADATTTHTCTGAVQGSGIVQDDGTYNFPAYIDSNSYDYTGYMSRQEFLKLLYDSANLETAESYKFTFSDVPQGNTYWPYILAAYDSGYIQGVGNGKFAPTEPISRAQIATVVVRVVENNGFTTDTCNTTIPDLTQGQWYSDDMQKAASMCLFAGDQNGLYHPTEPATNMEAIAVVYRLFRNSDGLTHCKTADNKDFDSVKLEMTAAGGGQVPESFWGYEFLKDAAIAHTCRGSLKDSSINNVSGDIPDTSCNTLNDTDKTAVITQICSEESRYGGNSNGVTSGCYGSRTTATGSDVVGYQSHTYNSDINTTQGGAVSEGNNGYIVDVAGNVTDCNTPDNFHTVKIDYTRPTCEVTSTYSDRRLSQAGDYDGHWMGKNSTATISSFCRGESGTGTSSGCWTEKDTTFAYTSEIKVVDGASSVPNLGDAYVYDLAGNRSAQACPKKTVKIDHSGPSCKTYATYQKTTSPPSGNADLSGGEYKPDSTVAEPNWKAGWLNGKYTVRVISYCEKDVANNVKSGGDIGSGCKGLTMETNPSDKNNQRSSADFRAVNQVINEPKGAKSATSASTVSSDKYEHKSFAGSGNITRRQFAEMLLKALDITATSSSHPFTDVPAGDAVVGTVYSNGMMIGTTGTTFTPDRVMTRAEMIVAVMRAYSGYGVSNTAGLSCKTPGYFTDLNSGAWYYSDVAAAVNACIIVGYGSTTLGPDDPVTAQQAHATIDRAFRYHDPAYKCTPDLSNRGTGDPWNKAGDWEASTNHTCTRDQPASSSGDPHIIYDNVGNQTTCEKITVKLDDVKPVCKVVQQTYQYDSGSILWTKNSSITVSKKCTDQGSGCHDGVDSVTQNDKCNTQTDSRTYTLSTANATSYGSSGKEKSWIGYACSSKESSGRVYDNVGNYVDCGTSNGQKNVGIDQTPPTCTISQEYEVKRNSGTASSNYKTPSGYNGWTNVTAFVQGACDDKGSGCKTTASQLKDTHNSYTNKTYTYSHTTVDNVGNTSNCPSNSYTVKVSTSKPSCSTSKVSGTTHQTTGVSVNLTCNYSGATGVYLWECNGTNIASSSKTSYSINPVSTGLKSTTSYNVKDYAGNTNTCSVTITPKYQYQKRTCSTCSTCDNLSSCKTCGTCPSTTCETYKECGDPPSRKSSCGCESYRETQSCSRCGCDEYNKKTDCNYCRGCDSWGSWSGWSDGGPYSDTYSTEYNSRTVYD